MALGASTWFNNQLKNPGSQIYKDIILFVQKDDDLGIGAYEGVQWYIKKEGFDAIQKNPLDGDIYEKLASNLDKNRMLFAKALGPGETSDWDKFKEKLLENMKAEDFFKSVN